MPKTKTPAATPEPTPETKVKNYLSKNEQYREDQAKLASTLVIVNLDDNERSYLAVAQDLYRGHSGCTTPFNEFIRGLLLSVEMGRWPTPDDVAHELETFRDNFESAKSDMAAFTQAYPFVMDAELLKRAKEAVR